MGKSAWCYYLGISTCLGKCLILKGMLTPNQANNMCVLLIPVKWQVRSLSRMMGGLAYLVSGDKGHHTSARRTWVR